MIMKNKMSDDEWGAFLDAIPRNKVSPFGSYEEFLKREGVTDEDIRLWNSLSEEERQQIKDEQQEGTLKILMMMTENDKLSPEDAVRKLYKQMTTYEDYPYTQQTISELHNLGFTSVDDYPLPWELAERVNKYSKMILTDTARFMESQQLVKSTTSSNAATRVLIKHGIV
jgi:hypothetical protein